MHKHHFNSVILIIAATILSACNAAAPQSSHQHPSGGNDTQQQPTSHQDHQPNGGKDQPVKPPPSTQTNPCQLEASVLVVDRRDEHAGSQHQAQIELREDEGTDLSKIRSDALKFLRNPKFGVREQPVLKLLATDTQNISPFGAWKDSELTLYDAEAKAFKAVNLRTVFDIQNLRIILDKNQSQFRVEFNFTSAQNKNSTCVVAASATYEVLPENAEHDLKVTHQSAQGTVQEVKEQPAQPQPPPGSPEPQPAPKPDPQPPHHQH